MTLIKHGQRQTQECLGVQSKYQIITNLGGCIFLIYCYSYSFGELLVHGLFAKYQEDNKGFVKKYIELLSSGSTNTPESLVKKTGLDITRGAFWESSMYLMNGLLKEAEGIFYKK